MYAGSITAYDTDIMQHGSRPHHFLISPQLRMLTTHLQRRFSNAAAMHEQQLPQSIIITLRVEMVYYVVFNVQFSIFT